MALIFVSLGAGMAAQGAHAVWFDERQNHLELPWNVKLWVSFVPPISGLATLHLVVKMAEDLIGTIRLLVTSDPVVLQATPPDTGQPAGVPAPAPPSARDTSRAPERTSAKPDARVVRIVRANPRASWRVVKARTGLTDASAKRALTAARKTLRATSQDEDEPQPLDARPTHANGRSS